MCLPALTNCCREMRLYLSGGIALGLSVAASHLLGFGGVRLIAGIVILWFPICGIWEFIFSSRLARDDNSDERGHDQK